MPLIPAPRPDEARGDFQRRRARYGLVLLLAMALASAALFGNLARMWPPIAALEGFPFVMAATLLGAALACAPLLAFLGLVLAVWNGVESVYQPRRQASPLTDKVIVALGLFVWFGPSLALLVLAVQAIVSGRVHFAQPARDYFLASDPIAFWQGVGFWLVIAASLGYLAWRYWRGKLFPATATATAP